MNERTRRLLKRVAHVGAWVIGGGGLCVAVFFMAFFLSAKREMRGRDAPVPELKGMTRQEAAELTADSGLVLEVVDQRYDAAVSSGRVLWQEPAPGLSVRRGRRIKVVVSLGGKVLEVPELVGQPNQAVSVTLSQEGLQAGGEARVHNTTYAAGTVIAQNPPAGSVSVPGERVHRLVSLGPPERRWVMPDLGGRSRAQVEAWLRAGGFRLGPARLVAYSGSAPGTVVGQHPPAGYPIRSNGVVRLTVAR